MDGRISESMTATIKVKLINKKTGAILLEDQGKNTALEVAGAINEIMV